MQKFWSVYKNKYQFLMLLILVVFIPLFPKFPLMNIKGTYVAIRLEDVLIGVTVFLWFLNNISNYRKYFKQTVFQVILVFWLVGLISLISAVTLTHTVKPSVGFFNWFRRVEVMALFFVAASSIKSLAQVKILLKVMMVVTLLAVFYGFGQQWLHFPVITTNNSELSKGTITTLTPGSRINSTFAGHYDLAAYLSLVLCMIGSIFFFYKKSKEKVSLALTGFISFVLLGMTAARISFVAALLGLVTAFWLLGKKIFIILVILASIGSIVAIPDLRHRFVATITVNILNGGGPKYDVSSVNNVNTNSDWYSVSAASRAALLAKSLGEASISASDAAKISVDIAPGEPINKTEQGVYRSFDIRTNVEWPRAIRALEKNPFFGTGYSSITLATDNDILRSFGETGVLGTGALFLVFALLFKRFYKFIKENSGFEKMFIVGLISSIVAILVTALFIDILEASKIAELFWIFMGVGWAIITNFKYDE
jgi:hypothetical protein